MILKFDLDPGMITESILRDFNDTLYYSVKLSRVLNKNINSPVTKPNTKHVFGKKISSIFKRKPKGAELFLKQPLRSVI